MLLWSIKIISEAHATAHCTAAALLALVLCTAQALGNETPCVNYWAENRPQFWQQNSLRIMMFNSTLQRYNNCIIKFLWVPKHCVVLNWATETNKKLI